MPRFDVYRNPSAGGTGYVVDVQADLLDGLATRVVVPLLPVERRSEAHPELNPAMHVRGEVMTLEPQAIGTVPRKLLGRPVANLGAERDAITRALDILLTGF